MNKITLEWRSEQRGAVKTAFYRPANLTITVKSAKVGKSTQASWLITQDDKRVVNSYQPTMQLCQDAANDWILTRGWHGLWDSEWLASKITPYLQGYPLVLLEYGWQEKLGAYCNSPAEVVARHPATEAHKQWLKDEWGRLGYIEARALNALTFATSEEQKELILNILGRNEQWLNH